jgi:hypothetical protein
VGGCYSIWQIARHARGTRDSTSRAARRTARGAPATADSYRTGAEGRVSHLKRGYGLCRSRLKRDEGHQIWDGWAAFTYNADTYTTLP